MNHDVIVIGGRCSGASTGMLLARKGLRVLILEKTMLPKDTLSTHFVWPRGASYLKRWGLLDSVLQKTPSGTKLEICIEGIPIRGEMPMGLLEQRFQQLHGSTDGLTTSYFSARRHFLDHLLLESAAQAGAEVRQGFLVEGLLFDGDQVVGVRGRDSHGQHVEERAALVIGADGRRSFTAKSLQLPLKEVRQGCTFAYFSYFQGFNLGAATIHKRGRMAVAVAATNDSANMTLVYGPREWFPEFKKSPRENFLAAIRYVNPELGETVASAQQVEKFYGTADQTAFLRTSSGPGWALIGDAACFKDQCTASGQTHAFRDAELLAQCVGNAFSGTIKMEDALEQYSRLRFLDSWNYYEFVCAQADMNPTRPDELQLFQAIAQDPQQMGNFIGVYGDTLSPSRFFSRENVLKILRPRRHESVNFESYEQSIYDYYKNPFAKGSVDTSIPQIRLESMSRNGTDFAQPVGPDLLGRTRSFFHWQQLRQQDHTWQYSRTLHQFPGPRTRLSDSMGKVIDGINFASQDYLSLGGHPAIRQAAIRAIESFGPHSAGSPMVIGNTDLSESLERDIADLVQTEHVMLFPTGWAAGFGAIGALVRQNDHIVMDKLAHACLQQGAYSACRNVRRHPHLDVDAAIAILQEIRSKDRQNAILVISEGIFSMDSDTPDLGRLQQACHEFGATLMVDVAHDLGALGPNGGGQLEIQSLLGKVDLVMGSFSKTFASNGGFLATHSDSVKQFVKMYGNSFMFSNALSPIQSAVVLEALRIVRSEEGAELRKKLLEVVRTFRAEFSKRGIQCLGGESALVPVPIGDERVARVAHRLCLQRNIATMILEYPVVAIGSARFRLQVMASHTVEEAKEAAAVISEILKEARDIVERNSYCDLDFMEKSLIELTSPSNAMEEASMALDGNPLAFV